MPDSAVFTFTDPHEYQKSVRGADMEVFLPTRGDYQAQLTRIDLHRLWMQRGRQSLPIVARSSLNKERAVIYFLADARQPEMLHGGTEVTPTAIVVNALGAEHYHSTSAASHWAAMSLSPGDLAAVGRALIGRDLFAPIVSHVIRPAPELMQRLRQLHQAAGDLATTAPDILAHPEVARAIEDALTRGMVACLVGDMAAAGARLSGRQRVPVMSRFEEMLEAYPDRPLYLVEMCKKIGVSGRTLRLHCQEHLGMSPHRYLWLRRMYLARWALASAGRATTVTEVATDHDDAGAGLHEAE
jgi:AraC-like DNA-binding protein